MKSKDKVKDKVAFRVYC